MRSPARTATKTPRPSSPRPQQQQQPPPPPPWRLWFVGLLCAFAVVVVIERGGGAALDADPILNEPIGPESNPQLRRRKKPRVSLTKQAKNYLTKNARLYRLGHYVRTHSAGLHHKSGAAASAARVERARARVTRRHYGWLAYRGMAPVYLLLLVALTLWMGLLLEERTLPALRRLCRAAQMTEDAAGATVLALATGGFEVLFSTVETVEGRVGVGLNFVLGSGVVNFGLLPAIVALAAARAKHALPLELDRLPVLRDGAFALAAFAALLVVVRDGRATLGESLALLGLWALHVFCCLRGPRKRRPAPDDVEEGVELVVRTPSKRSNAHEWPATPAADEDDRDAAPRRGMRERFLRLSRACLPPALPDGGNAGSELRGAIRAAAPTLLGSALWLVFLLLVLTRLADLLALAARLPLGFAGAVFLPAVYAIPDVLVSAAVAAQGRGRAAVSTVLGVQVVTVLLGVGLPFTIHNATSKNAIRISGLDCDPALRWGVFGIGLTFWGACLAPLARGRPPCFGAGQAALVFSAYVAITATVTARTL